MYLNLESDRDTREPTNVESEQLDNEVFGIKLPSVSIAFTLTLNLTTQDRNSLNIVLKIQVRKDLGRTTAGAAYIDFTRQSIS